VKTVRSELHLLSKWRKAEGIGTKGVRERSNIGQVGVKRGTPEYDIDPNFLATPNKKRKNAAESYLKVSSMIATRGRNGRVSMNCWARYSSVPRVAGGV